MRREIFTVFDSAARAFLEPFFARTIEEAARMMRAVVNKPDHPFNQYPEDYILFHIGSFDEASGEITPCEPHSLGVAITYKDVFFPEAARPQAVNDA